MTLHSIGAKVRQGPSQTAYETMDAQSLSTAQYSANWPDV